jgi:hypothetical protein
MDFNSAVDLIIRDLNEARDIIDDLRNYPGVPAIQVELAKSKCRSAADVISLLKNMQGPATVSEKKKEPVIKPVEKKAKPAEKSEPQMSHTGFYRPPVTKKDKTIISGQKIPESAIFADTFSHLPNSLNEQLGSLRDDDDVSDILKTKPLANLSDAIGVNDKFLFIREIFNGNPESYEQAISKLNETSNIADAKAIILSYAVNNEETDASRQLLDLMKRKFTADE